jgi:hypothetical protein
MKKEPESSKKQRTRRREAKLGRPVRLFPSELARLLPMPELPDRSLTAIERQLDFRRERLERLAARLGRQAFVLRPRHIHVPDLAEFDALEQRLAALPDRRTHLTVQEFKVVADVIRKLREAVAGLRHRVVRTEGRWAHDRYLARVGKLVVDGSPELLESYIAGRHNRAGRNVHAAAMGRLRAAKLGPARLSEWGRRCAAARREKRRAAMYGESTSSAPESLPNEIPAPPVPELTLPEQPSPVAPPR